jgi:hypothetical protein
MLVDMRCLCAGLCEVGAEGLIAELALCREDRLKIDGDLDLVLWLATAPRD